MKRKILIIEDDVTLRENTTEMLELANYEVSATENGETGIAKAKELLPNLIICDIMMPEIDGYGVLYMLGKNPKTSSIPFIFLTAKAEKIDIRKGMELGADDYLTKPFHRMDLLNTIEARLKRSDAFRKDFTNDKEGLDDFINQARGLKELESLAQNKPLRLFKKKETIFHEGDYPNVLFFLNRGKVKLCKTNNEGKEYITGLIKEGEFFGYIPIMENRAYEKIAIAMEDSEVSRIPKADFLALLKNNRDVSSKFIKMISNNLQEKEEELLCLAYDTVRKRVATALISLQNRYHKDENTAFATEISRSDLASMVGTASESVIRTLADFKEEGLLRVEGKQIIVMDKLGLEKIW
jgi:CRP-like cAMP-binding protein/FixJ family two-component response regulator